jgi:signal transduction histidine kinase
MIESDGAHPELVALRREVEDLRLAVRARDDFIAIAAHELRNPMTPILGMTELALKAARRGEGACPPRVITLLGGLQRAVQDYAQRATRLLDVSRIETGNLRLEPSATDISVLVLSVVQGYKTAALRASSRLDVDLAGGIVGAWDRLAVEQVVENLVSNALKFGMGKPITVQLRSDGQSAVLTVQDRGIGMPADQQDRIFGRFEQVVTQHRGAGFGIGLWVACRLISAMNGQLAVSSNLGEGSTFTVTLPLIAPASVPPESAPPESAPPESTPPD